jgi:hypothetical protein
MQPNPSKGAISQRRAGMRAANIEPLALKKVTPKVPLSSCVRAREIGEAWIQDGLKEIDALFADG